MAVVIGPSPEMAPIVREFDCGVVAPGFTARRARSRPPRPDARGASTTLKEGADRAAEVHNAERNRDVVLAVVDEALQPRPGRPPLSSAPCAASW